MNMELYPSFIVEGKWNHNRYRILRLLGRGGIGKVYKVVEIPTGRIWALKVSQDLQSITKEYELLKRFQHIHMAPRIHEIDDMVLNSCTLHYIVMEYIEGENLQSYTEKNKMCIKSILGLALLVGNSFHVLHKNNVVFGDLKLENLMIDQHKKNIRIIDFGGVTAKGYSIKEFTPLYDRASWNMGQRRADEKYDLFSLNILMSILLAGSHRSSQGYSVDQLMLELKNVDAPRELLSLIHKSLKQKEISFEGFMKELEKIYYALPLKRASSSAGAVINVVFAGSIMLLLGVLSIYFGKTIIF